MCNWWEKYSHELFRKRVSHRFLNKQKRTVLLQRSGCLYSKQITKITQSAITIRRQWNSYNFAQFKQKFVTSLVKVRGDSIYLLMLVYDCTVHCNEQSSYKSSKDSLNSTVLKTFAFDIKFNDCISNFLFSLGFHFTLSYIFVFPLKMAMFENVYWILRANFLHISVYDYSFLHHLHNPYVILTAKMVYSVVHSGTHLK